MLNLDKLNADEAVKATAAIADATQLQSLHEQEVSGKARKSVLAAIESALKTTATGKPGDGRRKALGQSRVLRLRRTTPLGAGTRKRGHVVATTEAQGKPVDVVKAVINGDANAEWVGDMTDREIANLKRNPHLIEVASIGEVMAD